MDDTEMGDAWKGMLNCFRIFYLPLVVGILRFMHWYYVYHFTIGSCHLEVHAFEFPAAGGAAIGSRQKTL